MCLLNDLVIKEAFLRLKRKCKTEHVIAVKCNENVFFKIIVKLIYRRRNKLA